MKINGEKLRQIRESHGLDREAMADIANLTHTTILKAESGRCGWRSYFRICDAYQISPLECLV